MLHRSYSLCLLLATLAGLNACASSERTAKVAGFRPEPIEMSDDEGRYVDKMVAGEPKGGSEEKCAYWKEQIVSTPKGHSSAQHYAERMGGGWCTKSGEL